jgi:hypothetical protein
MGMITVLLLRNDHLHTVQENAQEFIDQTQQAIQMHGMGHARAIAAGEASNVADVVSVAHASHDHFVRVHGNTAHTVGWNSATQDDLDAMAAFLKAKGYGIRKPRAKTTAQ